MLPYLYCSSLHGLLLDRHWFEQAFSNVCELTLIPLLLLFNNVIKGIILLSALQLCSPALFQHVYQCFGFHWRSITLSETSNTHSLNRILNCILTLIRSRVAYKNYEHLTNDNTEKGTERIQHDLLSFCCTRILCTADFQWQGVGLLIVMCTSLSTLFSTFAESQ